MSTDYQTKLWLDMLDAEDQQDLDYLDLEAYELECEMEYGD